jgi:hypothetical protein
MMEYLRVREARDGTAPVGTGRDANWIAHEIGTNDWAPIGEKKDRERLAARNA